MAASRASSFRALGRVTASTRQVRHLHMTGPATYASPILTSERPAFNLPKDIASLRAECKKRNLPATGSKQELTDRLSAESLVSSARAFSTALESSKRPSAESKAARSAREYNTSRALKAVHDTSTIDFAYLPDFDPDLSAVMPSIRVPLLPQALGASTSTYKAAEGEAAVNNFYADTSSPVMRPEISLVSADSTHISAPSAMTEVHDNNSMNIDFRAVSERVTAATKKATGAAEKQASGLRDVWNGFLDDVFGSSKPAV